MKNTLLSFFVALLLNLGIAGPNLSYSGLLSGISKKNNLEMDSISRKEFTNARLNNYSARAVRNFERSFKGATDKEWYILDDGYIAYFKQDGVQKKAAYDQAGRWVHTLSFFQEKNLPTDLRRLIKREYYDYSIYFAVEIEKYEATVFIVKMENDNALKTVRVWQDEMEEIENYLKSFGK